MNPISQITASNQICDELVFLGVKPRAFFWNLKENDIWDVWEVEEQPEYKKNETVPAWTKEELDVMIGGDIVCPRLPEQINVKVISARHNEEKVTKYSYEYIFFEPKTMFSWQPSQKLFNPGATASAYVLKKAIQQGWIDIELVNERYNQFFKHGNA